jgi:hypothetical protein
MTTVAQRSGRPRRVVSGLRGVLRQPPFGARLNVVRAPRPVDDVPLRAGGIVVVAAPQEVALLPLCAIRECHVFELEIHERIRLAEIAEHDTRICFWIGDDVRHSRVRPALVRRGMTSLARDRADIAGFDVGCVCGGFGRGDLRRICRQANRPPWRHGRHLARWRRLNRPSLTDGRLASLRTEPDAERSG